MPVALPSEKSQPILDATRNTMLMYAAPKAGKCLDATANQPVDLAAFDSGFEAAEASEQEEVPDGKYQVRVDRVRLDVTQKGNPALKWDLIVLNGKFAGRHMFKNSVITQASLPFVKGDLKTLGLHLPKFSDLPNRLAELLDLNVEVTKRTKGEYTNVYFNKMFTPTPGTPAPGSPVNKPSSAPGNGVGPSNEPAPF